MFSGPLEDRILIRERYGAYSDATFRQDVEGWLDSWHDDGVWAVFGKEISGKDAMRKQWAKIWQGIDCMGFFAEIGAIEVRGEEATARSYCREIVSLKNGGVFKVVASYTDKLAKVDGNWLFTRREYGLMIQEKP